MAETQTPEAPSAATNVSAAVEDNFAIDLTDRCDTDGQWFAVMRFGMAQLSRNPRLLMECIVRRAERLKRESVIPSKCAADFAAELMDKLDLRFEVCSSR